MTEMRAIHFEKDEKKTQYALMLRKGDSWVVYQGVWAEHDDTAREAAAALVRNIRKYAPRHEKSVFTLMKMLATTGTEET